ncbi:hypothetical protein BCR44DRAFT_1422847 [Catenaria anguillulae PL171]|uniref:Uncharacterized protein n=1 Tax=Catenaria anguillulae PL171 TaxID=765915 RepID=A0A1Y2I3M0_9FUNG|nr:hypothetical protein BCR44DRAFT_1422847 [Catenaria anguillulae PL171]
MSHPQRPPAGLIHGYAMQANNEHSSHLYAHRAPHTAALAGSVGHTSSRAQLALPHQWERDPPGRREFTPEQRNAFIIGLLTHGNNFAAILDQFGRHGAVSNVLADFTTAHLQDKTRVLFDRAHWRGLGAGCKTYLEWVALLPRNPSLLWDVVQDEMHADQVTRVEAARQGARLSVPHYGASVGGAAHVPIAGAINTSSGIRIQMASATGMDFDDSGLGGMSSTNSSARDSTPGMSTHRSHSPRLSASDLWQARSRDRVSRLMPPPMSTHVSAANIHSDLSHQTFTHQWGPSRVAAAVPTIRPPVASFPPNSAHIATNLNADLYQSPFGHTHPSTISSTRSTRDHLFDPSMAQLSPELMPPPTYALAPRLRPEDLPAHCPNTLPPGHPVVPSQPAAVAVAKDSAVASWASTVAEAASSAGPDSLWSEEELIALEEGLKLHHLSNSRRPRYKFVQEMFGAQGARANVLQFRTRKEMRSKAHELIRERRVLGLPVDPYLDSDGEEESGSDERDGGASSSGSKKRGNVETVASGTPNPVVPPSRLSTTGTDLLSPEVDAFITTLHDLANARAGKGIPKTVSGDEQRFTLAQDRVLVHGLLDATEAKARYVWKHVLMLHGPSGSRSQLLANRSTASLKRRMKILLTASMRRGDSHEGLLKPIVNFKAFDELREAWGKEIGRAGAATVSNEAKEGRAADMNPGFRETARCSVTLLPVACRQTSHVTARGSSSVASYPKFLAPSVGTTTQQYHHGHLQPSSLDQPYQDVCGGLGSSTPLWDIPNPHADFPKNPSPHALTPPSPEKPRSTNVSSPEPGHLPPHDSQHQLDAVLSSLLSFEPPWFIGSSVETSPAYERASQSLEDMLRAPMHLSDQASSLLQPSNPESERAAITVDLPHMPGGVGCERQGTVSPPNAQCFPSLPHPQGIVPQYGIAQGLPTGYQHHDHGGPVEANDPLKFLFS